MIDLGTLPGGTSSATIAVSGDIIAGTASTANADNYAVAWSLTSATSTTVTASPNPAGAGETVTLTATEIAADGTNPAGSVQFESAGTDIGSPVAVNSSGVATMTTSFAAPGTVPVSAVFTPTNTITDYTSSTGTYTETVRAAFGTEPVALTVPVTGSFTLTVATGTVTLAVSGSNATGVLNPITVSDTRNTFPG